MAKKILLVADEAARKQYIIDAVTKRVIERIDYGHFSTQRDEDLVLAIDYREIYFYENGKLSRVVGSDYYGSEGTGFRISSRTTIADNGMYYEVLMYHGGYERSVQKIVKTDGFRRTEYYFDVASAGGHVRYIGKMLREQGKPDTWSRCILGGVFQELLFGLLGMKNSPKGAVRFVSLPIPHMKVSWESMPQVVNGMTLLEKSEMQLSEFDSAFPYPNREWP